jgi:hypothetical protein
MTNGQDPTRAALDDALAGLVRDQRQWIARDPVRVRTLLQHTFAGSPIGQSREAEAAVMAIQFGVFDVLAAPDPAAVDGLIEQMTAHGGVTPDEATWAVHSWARAAGVPLAAAPPLGATVPVPPPTPPPTQPPAPVYPTEPPAPVYAAAPPTTPPPGYPPQPAGLYGVPPGGPPSSSTSSRLPLLIGLIGLAFIVIIGALAFVLTRHDDVATPPVTTPVTAAPNTAAANTTTTADDTTSTRRSTTTRRATTTTEDTPTSTDPPTTPAPTWSTFNDPSGRYSIDFPGSPQLSTSNTNIGGYDVGIFDYGVESNGISYELAVLELPPNFYFPNPQSTLESVVGSFVSTDGGSVTARDASAFAGNPALFLAIKTTDLESNVFGLIAGNRIYVMEAKGADFTQADFPRFRASFQIH